MKVIIDIPKEEYDIIKNYKSFMSWTEGLIKKGVAIPEGATNGDVIKTVFSSYKFSDDFGWINIVLNGRSCSFCSAEFWKAPYKGVEE